MTLSYRIGATALLVLLTATLAAPPANAQYFGRNRVQYDRFDFQVLETEHFDIHYYPEEREAAEQAGVMAERWYSRLSRLLNHRLRGRQVIIYYASHPHFQQTNAIGGAPGEATGGVTEVFKRRIVLPFAGPLKETDHVLGHELVHAFQFDMTGQGKVVSETTAPVALRLPLWFIEGMAEYLSVGPNDPHTTMWIRDATANDRLPSIGQLYDPRYFPYRFGQAFWAYIAGRWGDDVVGRILNAAGRSGSAEAALQRVLRVPPDSLVSEWHESIRLAYDPIREDTKAPGDYGELLLSTENSGGLNTAPALSPDGSEIVFLSERDLFSIDMYRADALTGEVYKRRSIRTSRACSSSTHQERGTLEAISSPSEPSPRAIPCSPFWTSNAALRSRRSRFRKSARFSVPHGHRTVVTSHFRRSWAGCRISTSTTSSSIRYVASRTICMRSCSRPGHRTVGGSHS